MSKLMLIDAGHSEETRVAILSNGQVDDFDFETAGKRQLRGNIYLAKVTRVEPSLQAAFVEYGGNRHGFLAFSEIHPDYYQLPQADREALLREEQERTSSFEDDDEDGDGDSDNGDDGDDEGRSRRKQSVSRRYKIQEVIRRRQIMLVQVVKEERGNKGAALTTFLSLAGRYGVLMPNTPRGGGISRKITSAADRKRLKEIVAELDVPDGMGLIVRTAGAKRTKTELKRDYDYLIKLWDKIRERTMTSMAPVMIHEEGNLVQRAMRDLFEKEIEEVLVQGDDAYREAKDLAKLLMPSQAKKVKQYKESRPLFVEHGIEEQLDNIFSPTVRLKSGGYLVINQTEALVAIDVNSGKSTRERNIEQTAVRTNLEAAEEACRQMRLRDLAGLIVVDFIDMDEAKNVRAVEKKMKDCLKSDRARVQNGRISMFGLMEISRQRRRAGVLETTSHVCETCAGTGRIRSVESSALQLLRALEARLAYGNYERVVAEAPTEVALYLLNNKRASLADLEEAAGTPIAITSSAEMINGDFTIEAERIPGSGDAEEKAARKRQQERKNRPPQANTSDEMDVIDLDEEEDDEDTPAEEESDAEAEEKSEDGQAGENGQGRKRRRRGRRGGRRRRGGREDGAQAGEDSREGSDAGSEETSPAKSPEPVSLEGVEPATLSEPAPEDGGALLDGIAASSDELLEGVELEEERRASRRRRGGRRRSGRRRNAEVTENGADTEAEAEDAVAEDGSSDDADGADAAETNPTEVTAAEEATAESATHTEAEPEPEAKPKPRRRRRSASSDKDEGESEVKTEEKAEESKATEPQKTAEPAPEPEEKPEAAPESVAEDNAPKRRGWWQRKLLG